MAVRLHMNLGLLAESQRLTDSADTIVVVEPTIGSMSRTKGSLFLLVTGAGGRKLREATKLVAEKIRDDYYYDLSAGISVCLRKAIRAANKVLLHWPERPAVGADEPAPIGLALAVVRSNELYVATIGPAEAYMVRQARLLTHPDASPNSGMPAEDIEGPEVWHGDITAGDCLILVSPNVTRRVGLGPIQEAVLQLHPQAAVEQIHRQFRLSSLGSSGGDGLLFIEATEVAYTNTASPLKPVWPGESLAGAPEHSPIPLADTVAGGVAAMQTTARHAQVAADGWLRRGVYALFDRLPRRPAARGRVTPMNVRRERQHRAAVAIIGLLAVITLVGTSMWFVSGTSRADNVDRQQQAQQAFVQAKSDVNYVYGSGRNLMASDPETAAGYLKDAFKELGIAQQNGYPPAELADWRAQVVVGLDNYYNVTIVNPRVVLSFGTDDLEGLVLGPDGEGYVLDNTNNTVYWVNLQTGAKVPVVAVHQQPPDGSGVVGDPRLLTTGGGDVLVLDSFNSLWRWRPALGSDTGRGSLIKVSIPDNEYWGLGARAIGTYLVNKQIGQYDFYIVVPSRQEVIKYPPALDGSGFPRNTQSNYLAVAQDVSKVDDMYIDSKIYMVDGGKIQPYLLGQAVHGWSIDPLPDTLIRPQAPFYTRLTADNPDQGDRTFYGYDGPSRRIVAFKESDGSIAGEYMVAPNSPWFSAVTGMFVTTQSDGSTPTLYWTESGNLMSASLTPPVVETPTSTPTPRPSPSRSLKPQATK